jgi:hypothetical protein
MSKQTLTHVEIDATVAEELQNLGFAATRDAATAVASAKRFKQYAKGVVVGLMATAFDRAIPAWKDEEYADRPIPAERGRKIASVRNSMLAVYSRGDKLLQKEVAEFYAEKPESAPTSVSEMDASDIARYITARKGAKGRLKTAAKCLSEVFEAEGFRERNREKETLTADKLGKKLADLGVSQELFAEAFKYLCENLGEAPDNAVLLNVVPLEFAEAYVEVVRSEAAEVATV